MPYLSAMECEKFIADAGALLNSQGVLYISFVDGNYADSGLKASSTGDRTYFYFHSQEYMLGKMKQNGFKNVQVLNKIIPTAMQLQKPTLS